MLEFYFIKTFLIESERKRAFRKKYSSYKEQLKSGLENKEMRAMPTVFRNVDDANPAQKNESHHSELPAAVAKVVSEDNGPEIRKNRSNINSQRFHSLSNDVSYIKESKGNLQRDGSGDVCDGHEANNLSAKAVRGLYLMIFSNIRKKFLYRLSIVLANIYHN